MNEKQQIEYATAEGFLFLYNEMFSSNYSVTEIADAPDIRCKNESGNNLNLEITLTEDRPKDIQAALGRSNHRDLSYEPLGKGSSLSDKASENITSRIQKKALKRYGPNTALVIRDSSSVDWDWNLVSENIASQLKLKPNPFDQGIWILNLAKTRIFLIL